MVADYCELDRRSRATGILIAGAAIGASMSSILGGSILDSVATRPIFRLGFAGSLAPWQSALVVLGAPGLLVALAMFAIAEPKRRNSVGTKLRFSAVEYLMTNRATFLPLYAAFALTLVSAWALAAWYPAVLMRNLYMAPHQAGLAIRLMSLTAAGIGGWGGGFLSDRFANRDPFGGRLKVIRISILANAVGILPLMILNTQRASRRTRVVLRLFDLRLRHELNCLHNFA